MKRSRIKTWASVLALGLVLNACGTKSVMMTVLRPAEVNLKSYSKIAVGSVVNQSNRLNRHSEDIADEITTRLVKSGRFDVIDRQHLKAVLKEQSMAASGLIDEKSAPTLGRLLGVSALIFGKIRQDVYKESTVKDAAYKDKKGRRHQRFHRNGQYLLGVMFKIIAVQTSKILLAKNLSAGKTLSTSRLDGPAPKIDRSRLYEQCVKNIGEQFIKLVAPYKQQIKANFETDKKLPQVDRAVSLFKVGEWDQGLRLLKKATLQGNLEPKVKAKAYYDYGLGLLYHGSFDGALKNIREALKRNPASSRYQKAIRQAQKEIAEAEKLKEQLK